MKIVERNSPNQSQRLPGDVRIIVCHTPEGNYAGAISTCMNPVAQVSYHMLIKKDGTEATQLVPFDRKAWHAKSYNSFSEGISLEGNARTFSLLDKGSVEMAKVVARRLYVRGLKPQWTTDPAKGGFCRHGDLQSDRTDPTPDLAEWRLFVGMVQDEYSNLKPESKPWPLPIPAWFWQWMIWLNKNKVGPRPADAPRFIPAWAWRRRAAWLLARRV